MLKHHPKLRKLWNKAVKRTPNHITEQVLDMRYTTSKEFMKEFQEVLKSNLEQGMKDFADFINKE